MPASEKPRRFSGSTPARSARAAATPQVVPLTQWRCDYIEGGDAFRRNQFTSRKIASMILSLLRTIGRAPLGLLHFAGTVCGWAAYALVTGFRRKTRQNLTIAGLYRPGLAWASAAAAGQAALETCYIWFRPAATLLARSRCDAYAELARQTEARRLAGDRSGTIILTPHIGSFELGARIYAALAPITVLYKAPRRDDLHRILQAARSHPQLTAVPADTGGVRSLLRALKRGEAIGILPDQVPSAGEGRWAAFFGRPAFTMTLPARLAERTGAPVYLLATWRLPFGRGWDLELERVEEAPEPEAINRRIEAVIRRRPGQYVWSYNRYKVPPGEPVPGREAA
ncbi:MAG: lysophospholipid acyltransferase family protein [Lautropia sp.]